MDQPKYLFVMGCRKSGTTWLQSLLDSHPNIMCCNEGLFHAFGRRLAQVVGHYNKALDSKIKIFGERTFPNFGREEFQVLFRNFVVERLRREALHEGSKNLIYHGEKDPNHVLQPEVLMDCFPDARFIHIIRDGRDVAVSWWHHMIRYDEERVKRNNRQFGQVAMNGAREWSKDVRKVREQQARTGVAFHELRYEALLEDPEKTLTAMFEFLDVPRTKEIVAKCLEETSFAKMSGGRTPGEEDKSSFYRKGVKGDWRNHMTEEQSQAFIQASSGVMQELGYA